MIKRTPEKTTQLSVAQYQGQARPGEIVIDEATYQMYIANGTGDLNAVGGNVGNVVLNEIENGASNIAIPLAGANIHVGVSGIANVVNFAPTQVDFKANIVPVGDAVYSLGSPSAQFKDLYLSNSTLYMDLVPITVVGNVLTVGNANVLTESANGTLPLQNVIASGNIIGSNITALGTVGGSAVTSGTTVTANTSLVSDSWTSRTGSLNITAIGADQNITLRPSGSGVVDVDSSRITGVSLPTGSTDAASKAYVDAVASGLIIHQQVAAATTTNLAGVYSPGFGGVGATLTLNVPTTFLDGYAMAIGDRILVKNQTNAFENGVYVRNTTSVLTRATDFDQIADFERAFVFVVNGSVNGRTGWVQMAPVATVGGSDILFYQFSAAGTYNAGTGLALSGVQFSLANTTVTAGTYGNGTRIPSLIIDPQGRITGATLVPVDSNVANLTGTTLNSNITISNITQLGTLSFLNVGGQSNLGDVGNVIITGGNPGEVLITNGVGNLSWGPFPIASNIANGVSNVNIPIGGGNVVVTAGTVNSANITAFGIVSSNLTANSNVTTANLTVSNISNLGSISNVKITGGFPGQVIVTDGLGNLTFGPGGGGGGGGSYIANGTSNVYVDFNSNVNFDVNGVSQVLVVSDTSANFIGAINAVDALITGNLTVAGTTNYVNVQSLQVVDPIVGLGGGANGAPLIVNDGKDRGLQLTYFTTQQLNAFMGWDNSGSEFVFGSNVTNVNDVITFNQLGNVRANTFLGNITGMDIIASNTANLGSNANVTILGGTSGQVLSTDGFGALSWVSLPAAPTTLANGTSTIGIPTVNGGIILTSNGHIVANAYSTAAGAREFIVNGLLNFPSGGTASADFSNTGGIVFGNVANINISNGTAGQYLTAHGNGKVYWSSPTAGSQIANGFSNVTIPSVSGNVGVNVSGALIMDVGMTDIAISAGVNLIMGTGEANFVASPTVRLGPNSNVKITGGTAGQVLSTDGTGSLSWVTVSGSGGLANGTSNVEIPVANDAVLVHSNGLQIATFYSDGTLRNTNIFERLTIVGNGSGTGGGNVSFGTGAGALSFVDFEQTFEVRLGPNSNVKIGGGTAGQVLSTDGSNNLSWVTIAGGSGLANGTSYVTIPVVDGSIQAYTNGQAVWLSDAPGGAGTEYTTFYGKIQTDSAANVDFSQSANVALGPAANLNITGGTNGHVLTTDGSGVVSWAPPSYIDTGASNSLFTLKATASNYLNLERDGNLITYWTTGTTGDGLAYRAMGVTGTLEVSEVPGENQSGVVKAPAFVVLTTLRAGTGAALINFDEAANVNLGSIGNLHISGGTAGQVLTTDGSGGLSWGSGGGTPDKIANGTSNISIPTVNTTIVGHVGGTQMFSVTNSSFNILNGGFWPSANNSLEIGNSSLRWANIFANTGNFSGNITVTSNVTTANLTVGTKANLGAVGNVIITGGTSGQILSTDGSGVLSWTSPSSGNTIVNGTSNVVISATNGNIRAFVGGNLLQNWFYNSASFSDEILLNAPVVRAGSSTYILFDGAQQTWLGSNSKVVITGGTNGQYLKTNGSGGLSWDTPTATTLANGTSNVSIPSSGDDVLIHTAGNLRLRVDAATSEIYSNAAVLPVSNVSHDLGKTGQMWGNIWSRDYYAQGNYRGSGNILINGDIQSLLGGLAGNIGASGSYFRNIYTANIHTGNIVPLAGFNDITVGSANLLPTGNKVYDLGSATQRWKDIYLSNNTIYLGDGVLSVDGGNLTVNGNSVVVQNVTGGNTVIEGNIVAPGDITSNGNVVAGNLITAGTLDVSGTANLGAVGNITILGGTSGQVLSTDGNGVLSWTTVGGGGGGSSNMIYSNLGNGYSSVKTSTMQYDPGANLNLFLIQNEIKDPATGNITTPISTQLTQMAGSTYTTEVNVFAGSVGLTAISDEGTGNVNISAPQAIKLNSSQGTIELGGNVLATSSYEWNLTSLSNLSLGDVANLHISGGTSGQVLSTDGSGGLSWITAGGGGGSGNSISTDNGNIAISLTKDANSSLWANASVFNPYTNTTQTLFRAFGSNDSANSVMTTVFQSQANVISFGSPNTTSATLFATNVSIVGTNVNLGGTNVIIRGSQWPSGTGSNGQVLTTDGTGNLSWAAGGGGTPTALVNGQATVFAVDPYVTISANAFSYNFFSNGAFQTPNVANTKLHISGTSTVIYADPHPAQGSGNLVVWTASGTSTCGAKMVLRAKNNSTGHVQMMEIMMAKDINNSSSSYTVSNRVKSDTSAADIQVDVALNTGRLQLTAVLGGTTHTFTYTVDEFQTL